MSLRTKALLINSCLLLISITFLYFVSIRIVQRSYHKLEVNETNHRLKQANDTIELELNQLAGAVMDWAAWDEAFAYMVDRNPKFIKVNFETPDISYLRVNAILLVDSSGKTAYATGYEYQQKQRVPLPEGLLSYVTQNALLLQHTDLHMVHKGIVLLPHGPILLASHPIVTGDFKGPSHGTLIMGRFLDKAEVNYLAKISHLPLRITRIDTNLPLSDHLAVESALHTQEQSYVKTLNEKRIAGYALIANITGKPSLLLSVENRREIYQQGKLTIHYFLLAFVGIGVIFGLLALIIQEKLILSRVAFLSRSVKAIGMNNTLAGRVTLPGSDELSSLAGSVNDMLSALETSQEALRKQEAQLESDKRYRSLVELSPEAVFIIRDGKCLYSNQAGIRMMHMATPDEIIGCAFVEMLHPEDRGRIVEQISTLGEGEELPLSEIRLLLPDGTDIPVEVTAVLNNYQGQDAMQIIARDISARKRSEEQLHYLAYYDNLTGLPNRQLFKDRLTQAISRAERADEKVIVLLIDLDHFKEINDTLGHLVGDHLLQAVAARMRTAMRTSDTVTRVGGDEFVMIFPDFPPDSMAAEQAALRILDLFINPFNVDGQKLHITPSIGISIYPHDGEDMESLVKHADLAMYRAKEMGRNRAAYFSIAMESELTERKAIERDLREALERDEFVIHYQPQVDITINQVVGMEALVRWQHPVRGLIPPDRFIPLAEEIGLVIQLDEMVLRKACKQSKAWQDAGLPPIRMAVNLASHHFQQVGLVDVVQQALVESGLAPEWLELEITESAAMQNVEFTVTVLHELQALGVRIAIDDFGNGYSSFGYLKQFPADRIKIDRSFIKDLLNNSNDVAIVGAIIAMMHTLNCTVIAESVETVDQLNIVRAQGCDEVQGYFYAKPMSADSAADFIREQEDKRLPVKLQVT